jgi:hypothetical protein
VFPTSCVFGEAPELTTDYSAVVRKGRVIRPSQSLFNADFVVDSRARDRFGGLLFLRCLGTPSGLLRRLQSELPRNSIFGRQAGSIPAVAPQSGNFAEAVVTVATSSLQKRRTRELKEKMDRVEWDKCEPSERAEQSPARNPSASSTRQCIEVNAPLGKLLESHSHQVCVLAVQRFAVPPPG